MKNFNLPIKTVAAPDFRKPDPHPDPLPSDGRGESDWMIAVICKRVERDTASGGSEIGGSGRMRPAKTKATY
jgi:hypothetical protein